jgi:hypothetical protein
MTYENIKFKEHDDGAGGKLTATIEPFLVELIEKLALKYPQWVFEEEHSNFSWSQVNGKSVRTGYVATHFKVMDKREELGSVYLDNYARGKRFAVDNFRVQEMRERGNGMKTIHLSKAMKHIDKFFGKKNITEKVQEACKVAYQISYQVTHNLDSKMRATWQNLQPKAVDFLLDKHWEEFCAFAKTDAEDYPRKNAEAKASNAIDQALRKGDAYLVHIDGLDYAIQKGEKNPINMKASEELPDFIRRGVGMLKLLEDHQILIDVGLRVSPTTFVVLEPNIC